MAESTTGFGLSDRLFRLHRRQKPSGGQGSNKSVFLTSAITGKGIADVWQNISDYFAQMREQNLLHEQRSQQLNRLLSTVLE
jgi:putative protein kinase ArgK-like GTPase of G3E family